MKHYKTVFTTRKSFRFLLSCILISWLNFYLFLFYWYSLEYGICTFLLSVIIITLMFLFNNKIILEQYFIRINFGIFSYKVSYRDIKRVYMVESKRLSLSSSIYCVGLKTNDLKTKFFDLLVSPMDRDDFIYELKKRI